MFYRIAMVWKSIVFTFCLIKSWSHDQSKCTTSVPESLFPEALAQVFPCEFCEI